MERACGNRKNGKSFDENTVSYAIKNMGNGDFGYKIPEIICFI